MIDLKEFRKRNKLTQINLAEYFDCDQGFISQLETGKSPIPETYIAKIKSDGIYSIDNDLYIEKLRYPRRQQYIHTKPAILNDEELCLNCEKKNWEIDRIKQELYEAKLRLARYEMREELLQELKAELKELTEKNAVLNYRIDNSLLDNKL